MHMGLCVGSAHPLQTCLRTVSYAAASRLSHELGWQSERVSVQAVTSQRVSVRAAAPPVANAVYVWTPCYV